MKTTKEIQDDVFKIMSNPIRNYTMVKIVNQITSQNNPDSTDGTIYYEPFFISELHQLICRDIKKYDYKAVYKQVIILRDKGLIQIKKEDKQQGQPAVIYPVTDKKEMMPYWYLLGDLLIHTINICNEEDKTGKSSEKVYKKYIKNLNIKRVADIKK